LAEIRLQEGESLENALRRFKRKVQAEDIIKEVKRHSYYLKPGEKRRVKQALARKRARKKIRRERDWVNPCGFKPILWRYGKTDVVSPVILLAGPMQGTQRSFLAGSTTNADDHRSGMSGRLRYQRWWRTFRPVPA
jgi:small subunit ribosomal protein S21